MPLCLFRSDSSWEITFVRQQAVQSHIENMQLASGGCRLRHTHQMVSPALSPDENIAAKMSVLSMVITFSRTYMWGHQMRVPLYKKTSLFGIQLLSMMQNASTRQNILVTY